MASDPTARTLSLLSLLQSRARWPAAELAQRLGSSTRTLRRDAQRLRTLGYAVKARPGPGSTYRLMPGVAIPPLLFTADEVAVIVGGLRLAKARLDDEAAASALAKLEQVLPPTLRRRAAATDMATEVLDGLDGPAAADIGVIADAVASAGRIRFAYSDQHGRQSTRTVEPYRHVLRAGHWYLVAFDVDRRDWRTFRFDRISDIESVPGVFAAHDFPAESVRRWFDTDFGCAPDLRGSPSTAQSSKPAPSPTAWPTPSPKQPADSQSGHESGQRHCVGPSD